VYSPNMSLPPTPLVTRDARGATYAEPEAIPADGTVGRLERLPDGPLGGVQQLVGMLTVAGP
jgi:hypothetical protein